MPIIAAARGETKRIIEEAECGVCCGIGDAQELAAAVRKIEKSDLERMGGNSRAYFEKCFDKEKLMDEIEEYYK